MYKTVKILSRDRTISARLLGISYLQYTGRRENGEGYGVLIFKQLDSEFFPTEKTVEVFECSALQVKFNVDSLYRIEFLGKAESGYIKLSIEEFEIS